MAPNTPTFGAVCVCGSSAPSFSELPMKAAIVLTFVFLGVLALPSLHDVYAAIPLAAAESLATSRSEIYQRIARGELDAVKDGARTKITYESVKRVAAALPKADVKLYVRRAQAPAAGR